MSSIISMVLIIFYEIYSYNYCFADEEGCEIQGTFLSMDGRSRVGVREVILGKGVALGTGKKGG
jgi:hypothetical protein